MEAEIWDHKYGWKEQSEILEPIYKQLSEKALQKLDKMAKGKGIFNFGVPSELRFVGNIDDSYSRYGHGINKLLPEYLKNNKETEVNDLVELKTD